MDTLAYTPSSSSWAEEESMSGSLEDWDLIAWSETASPAVDSLSKQHDREMNKDAETTSSSAGYGHDQGASRMSGTEPSFVFQGQPSGFSYLDCLPSSPDDEHFNTDLRSFDLSPDTAAELQPLHELGNSSQETFEAINFFPPPRTTGSIIPNLNDASSNLGSRSVRPAELVLNRDGGEAASGFPGTAPTFTAVEVTLDPTGLSSQEPRYSNSQPSSRRRQRSPSPSPTAHQQRMLASMGCFQVEPSGEVNETSQPPSKKIRGPKSQQRRKEIADVRDKKACLRCRMQKLTCDGQTPCSNCLQARGKERMSKAICERLRLKEAITFRVGNSKFKQETAEVRKYPTWAPSATTRTITLLRPKDSSIHWPKGTRAPHLDIFVKEFVPGGDDVTVERWRSGENEVILELPAFSAFDNEATTAALLSWVDDNFELYAKDMTSQPGDWVIGATFDEALRYARKNPDSMVKSALKIWIGARMAQEFFCVTEDNDFEIQVVNDRNSIHHGQCPVPPVLDHQLDVLMIRKMMRMQEAILSDIENIIKGRKSRERWYEIYLTIFVLLANLQYVYKSQERWWMMHNNTGKGNSIGIGYQLISYRFMERYRFSAKNLLSHFRYGLKGPVPFTLDWDKEATKKLGHLDKDAVKYVKHVSANARRRRDEFVDNVKRVKQGEYEGEMFWLSQMFIDLSLEDDNEQTP